MLRAERHRIGPLVRQRLLGSEAVYEIVEVGEETVTASVVSAPGLTTGTRVRMLKAAVAAMESVEVPPASPPARLRRRGRSTTTPARSNAR